MSLLTGREAIKSTQFGVVQLHGVVTFGASGAVSSQTSVGFTVARSTTGVYTATTDAKYYSLIGVELLKYNGGTATDERWELGGEYSSQAITLHHVDGASTLGDPTSGHKLYITLTFKVSNK